MSQVVRGVRQMRAIQVLATDGPEALELGRHRRQCWATGNCWSRFTPRGCRTRTSCSAKAATRSHLRCPSSPGSEVAGSWPKLPPILASALVTGVRIHLPRRVRRDGGVAADNAHLLPEQVSFDVGASLPMNYLTVQFALGRRGRLAAGESVLVHGAAGGWGPPPSSTHAGAGRQRSPWCPLEAKAEVARQAGADEVVTADGFLDQVRELTRGRGVDVVVDPVGGEVHGLAAQSGA